MTTEEENTNEEDEDQEYALINMGSTDHYLVKTAIIRAMESGYINREFEKFVDWSQKWGWKVTEQSEGVNPKYQREM